jgi:hypothetical protein
MVSKKEEQDIKELLQNILEVKRSGGSEREIKKAVQELYAYLIQSGVVDPEENE